MVREYRDMRYPTDLRDSDWERLSGELRLPKGLTYTRTDLREIINAILYHARTGVQWRMLPHEFPPEGTVRRYYYHFKNTGQFAVINKALRRRALIVY